MHNFSNIMTTNSIHPLAKFLFSFLAIIALFLLVISQAYASAEGILKLSNADFDNLGKSMAEGVSKSSPQQIDRTTILLGAFYSNQTKTFIYKYKSDIAINSSAIKNHIIQNSCGNATRRAFLQRGGFFEHAYLTPRGEKKIKIKFSDCQ